MVRDEIAETCAAEAESTIPKGHPESGVIALWPSTVSKARKKTREDPDSIAKFLKLVLCSRGSFLWGGEGGRGLGGGGGGGGLGHLNWWGSSMSGLHPSPSSL